MIDFLPSHLLFRAIHPCKWDSEQGRPFRSAFGDYELSVYWSLFAEATEALTHWLSSRPSRIGSGIAEFTAGFALDQKQELRHDAIQKPDEPPPHPSHSLVIGKKNKKLQLLFAETVYMRIPVESPTFSNFEQSR